MTSKLKTDVLETVSGSGTIALTNQLSGMTSASVPSGSVLQVIVGTDNTELTLATTTYTDTGLSATITPSATNSKILVMWSQQASMDNNDSGMGIKMLRGSTGLYASANQYDLYIGSNGAGARLRGSWTYLDSPSTTSAITYKVQARAYLSRTIRLNNENNGTQITLMEIKG